MARETYERESEAYNAKGTGGKILERLVLSEKKPELRLPNKPQKRERLFESNAIAAKVSMEGLTKASGGVVVSIEIQGFEATEPEDAQDELKDKEGNIYYKYFRSMKYRQPVRYSVALPDGSVIVDEIDSASENYKTHVSSKYGSRSALDKAWNTQSISLQLSQSAVTASLLAINSKINDKYCFSSKTRPMTIYHVKSTKKADYTDLTDAAFEMKYAMEKYLDNQEEAMTGIRSCIPVWESAIAEADFENKKARIDKKVAGYVYLNMIQAHIWLEEYDKADRLFDDMRRLDTKKSAEGTAEGLDAFCEDQRRRKEANAN